MKTLVTAGILTLCALVHVPASEAASILTFQANLNGAQVVPPNGSPATGLAIVTVDQDASLLTLDMTWTGLVANATAAHIHCCAPTGANGLLAITFLGLPATASGSFSRTVDLLLLSTYALNFRNANGGTAAGAKAGLLAGLANGTAYAETLSTTFGMGEIRGNLAAVPEPATLTLLGTALAGLALRRQKRRRSLSA